MNRRVVALVALATAGLTACGVSAPPPVELADEIIGTLDVSDSVKDCMRNALAEYTDDDLKAITDGLDSENTQTQADSEAALVQFERDFAICV